MSKQGKLKIKKVQISKLDSSSQIKIKGGGGITDALTETGTSGCSNLGTGGNISVDGHCPTIIATGTENWKWLIYKGD